MKSIKGLFIFICSIFTLFTLCAETEGERLFKINNPSAAVPLLEQDIKSGNISSNTYNFLGLSYYQLGEYAKAIDTFEKGMKSPVTNKRILAFNEGHAAYSAGDYKKAESCFSLALAASPSFYPALLNRANSRLMAGALESSLEDYKKYIENMPDDPQRENINRMISYLEEELVRRAEEQIRLAEEQKRIEEENARMQEELARIQAEKAAQEAAARAAEEERRRKLLEEVANALQQTDSANITSGAAEVLDYDYESELD